MEQIKQNNMASRPLKKIDLELGASNDYINGALGLI